MISVLITLLIIVIVLLIESEREKDILSIERVSFISPKLKQNKKLIFITDLHDKEFGENNNRLIETIKKEKPDYILMGGDIITTKRRKTNFRVLEQLLKDCSDIAPIIYANGNHEERLYYQDKNNPFLKYQDEFLNILKKYNVTYLSNNHIDLDNISVYGLNLSKANYANLFNEKLKLKDAQDKLGTINTKQYNILLAHSPAFLDVYEELGIDLGLCGHFHGGVMRIGKQGVLTSQWQLFHKWCVGQFKINNANFIVSRGLGGHTIDVRINNTPELTIINLKQNK